VFLSGCFYLRLQQVREQLACFEQYYEIEEGKYYSLIAKKPVLLSSDIIRLMRCPPSQIDGNEPNFVFDYILEKQYPPDINEIGNYSVKVTFLFENDKLVNTLIDRRFFDAISKKTFISVVKAFGNSKVDIGKQSVSAMTGKTDQINVPDANEILRLLGKPYSKDGQSYTYKYAWKLPENSQSKVLNKINTIFTFNDKGKMLKCRSDFFGSPVELDLSSLYKKDEKQKK
jgi:hypothetical protein